MNECRCGKATRDRAYVCETCLDALARDLNEMSWLADEIETSRVRRRAAATGGSRSASTVLPWDEKASQAERGLHAALVGWVRFCVEERVRSTDYRHGEADDDLVSLARWLLWRVDGLAFHELGSDVVDEITSAVAEVRRVIFFKPAPKVYLGTCTAVVNGEVCSHSIYAKEGEGVGQCSALDCRAKYLVDQSRRALEDALDSRLVTAAEVATLAVHLGLDQPRERVRKRVNQWAKRGRIVAHADDESGAARYVYADVRALLYAEFVEHGQAM